MKKILLAFLFFCSFSVFAQYPDWKYFGRSYSAYTFAEEGDFMWIGNTQGIVKLNKITGAKTFYNKTNSPLPDNEISKIVIDKKGVKWFGTSNVGLVRFDGINWTVYDTTNSLLRAMLIQDITVDANNNLWISPFRNGVGGVGLIKYDGTTWTNYTTSNSGLPNNNIGHLFADSSAIWISTLDGLTKFDGTTWKVYNVSNSTISRNNGAININKDKNGNLWLLRDDGIEKFDGSIFTFFQQLNIGFYSMTVDADNIVWVGAYGYTGLNSPIGGVRSFNGTTWTNYDSTNSPISDSDIPAVYADQSNRIWIGGQNGTVDLKNGNNWTNYTISTVDLYGVEIKKIALDQHGEAFIQSKANPYKIYPRQGVDKYDWSSDKQIKSFATDDLWGIATDKFGNLYTKTVYGLDKYDGTNWTAIPNTPNLNYTYDHLFEHIATDTLGGVWISYVDTVTKLREEQGIAHYDGVKWTKYNRFNSTIGQYIYIYYIKVDHKNNVWVGSNMGLMKFDGKIWTNYTTNNSTLPTDFIALFTFDAMDNLWCPYKDHGLLKFDGNTCTIIPNPIADNLFLGGIDIAIDIDGSIWQAGNNKLVRFDGSNWASFTIPMSSGQNNGATCLSIDKFGNKWIGTNNGIYVYNKGGIISVEPIDRSSYFVSAFPNPFESDFEIQLNDHMNSVDLTLYDELGRQVFHETQKQTQLMHIPRNGLKSGIYFYQIKSDNGLIFNGKVIAK
jgi:ligand-binding sensor domain-containing protein